MATPLNRYLVTGVGTSPTTIYTCPAGKTAAIVGLNIANILTVVTNMTLQLQNSAGTTTANIIAGVAIPPNSSFIPSGQEQKIVMLPGDKLILTATNANAFDVIISVAETA